MERQAEIDKIAHWLLKISAEDGRLDRFCYGDERVIAELLVDNGIGSDKRFEIKKGYRKAKKGGLASGNIWTEDIQPIVYKDK